MTRFQAELVSSSDSVHIQNGQVYKGKKMGKERGEWDGWDKNMYIICIEVPNDNKKKKVHGILKFMVLKFMVVTRNLT